MHLRRIALLILIAVFFVRCCLKKPNAYPDDMKKTNFNVTWYEFWLKMDRFEKRSFLFGFVHGVVAGSKKPFNLNTHINNYVAWIDDNWKHYPVDGMGEIFMRAHIYFHIVGKKKYKNRS